MKIKKTTVFCLIFVLAVAVVSTAVEPISEFIQTSAKPKSEQVVIIDAGHGGLTNTID